MRHAYYNQPAPILLRRRSARQEPCSSTSSTHKGKTVFEQDLPADPDAFLDAVEPFREDLVVGCECMFAWYWLADLCEDERIPFVLGHALAMKAIHGGKAKTDRIDAAKIAGLLRGGMFPLAYVYPRAKRQTRDLLRRRSLLRPPAGPAHRPHRQHQQPVQPAAVRQEADLRGQPHRRRSPTASPTRAPG